MKQLEADGEQSELVIVGIGVSDFRSSAEAKNERLFFILTEPVP
jgi:hypothetical protein